MSKPVIFGELGIYPDKATARAFERQEREERHEEEARPRNKNCLQGIRCPQCGYEDAFRIEARIMVYVTDDGTEDEGGHYGWDEESFCGCAECDHAGTIKDFRIENQREAQS
jgi:hypothetical protein